jgi:hypothetical protein
MFPQECLEKYFLMIIHTGTYRSLHPWSKGVQLLLKVTADPESIHVMLFCRHLEYKCDGVMEASTEISKENL